MIIMEYLSKENVSLLDTVDDVSVWTLADIKVLCVHTYHLQEDLCDNEGIIGLEITILGLKNFPCEIAAWHLFLTVQGEPPTCTYVM